MDYSLYACGSFCNVMFKSSLSHPQYNHTKVNTPDFEDIKSFEIGDNGVFFINKSGKLLVTGDIPISTLSSQNSRCIEVLEPMFDGSKLTDEVESVFYASGNALLLMENGDIYYASHNYHFKYTPPTRYVYVSLRNSKLFVIDQNGKIFKLPSYESLMKRTKIFPITLSSFSSNLYVTNCPNYRSNTNNEIYYLKQEIKPKPFEIDAKIYDIAVSPSFVLAIDVEHNIYIKRQYSKQFMKDEINQKKNENFKNFHDNPEFFRQYQSSNSHSSLREETYKWFCGAKKVSAFEKVGAVLDLVGHVFLYISHFPPLSFNLTVNDQLELLRFPSNICSPSTKIIDIACGRMHLVLLSSDYEIFTIGSNNHGQCMKPVSSSSELIFLNGNKMINLTKISPFYDTNIYRPISVICEMNSTFILLGLKNSKKVNFRKHAGKKFILKSYLSKKFPCSNIPKYIHQFIDKNRRIKEEKERKELIRKKQNMTMDEFTNIFRSPIENTIKEIKNEDIEQILTIAYDNLSYFNQLKYYQ
ncbi:hypothetical protein TRFO_38019 [Tritrichomonas foetus]|uniref:Uncharacterized protein n=1 Tax=Tritrichomonas foetus TaxID=1144522 RepID=A0A1J4JDT4_9EUKA|nr:hypothetical protein TRFO_38019 [Tritrichomonas foetus]|eukprot:OHS95835.1 hypothetical protein TRFO_38019 [Tritrichomonas foetus]